MINLELIKDFKSIHFSELPDSMLINRVDTKYFFNSDLIFKLFDLLKDDYLIIDYGHGLLNNYITAYYDTDDLLFYNAHHNRRNRRLKVRQRTYSNSHLDYFEIKHKINGRTQKDRKKISLKDIAYNLDKFSNQYLENTYVYEKIITIFDRITFVDLLKSERVTIDFNLQFSNYNSSKTLDNIIILELKQDGLNRNSKIISILKSLNIRKSKFSKYFVGMNLLNSDVKYNNFKPIKLQLDKLKIGVQNA